MKYITTADYWNTLEFDYLVYYSQHADERVPYSKENKNMFPVTRKDVDKSKYEIARFANGSSQVAALASILTTPYAEGPVSACIPVYRDVIIFYTNNHRKVSILNICFECWKMSANFEFENVHANGPVVYPALANLFHSWSGDNLHL